MAGTRGPYRSKAKWFWLFLSSDEVSPGGVARGVAVGVEVGIAVEVAVALGIAVAVGVAVELGVEVAVDVAVGVAVVVAVAAGVDVGVTIGVAVGVGVECPWQLRNKIDPLPWCGKSLFAVARSCLPTTLKSPTTAEYG